MPKPKKKSPQGIIVSIYIKPVDLELFAWAKSQRQSLSEVIALALQEYREKREK